VTRFAEHVLHFDYVGRPWLGIHRVVSSSCLYWTG
jgi:hypothetical protein